MSAFVPKPVDPDDGTGNVTDSLEELMRRTAEGDKQAFAELYELTVPRVFGLVKRLLRDPAQSEEVTQEIYLEVWQNSVRYEPGKGAAIGWMITMAHRRAIDRIRASQASRDRDTRVGIRDWQESVDSVADDVETAIESARVREAMGRLTELQRQAVELAYFGGLSHSEVSERLHIPMGTVKTRLRDAMIRLRDELGVSS